MYTDSEGIVLRQTKTLGGRRMVVLFTKRYGKLSAGTSISEKGKSKSALALRPFTFGKYEFYKNNDNYSVNGAEVIKSYYEIGEDIDKFMAASYALELTDNILEDGQAEPSLFNHLEELLELLAKRKSAFWTPVLAFILKALIISGCGPDLKSDGKFFSVKDAKIINESDGLDPLVFPVDGKMLSAMRFMESHPIKSLDGLALEEDTEYRIRKIFKSYLSFQLGIEGLKSEGLHI